MKNFSIILASDNNLGIGKNGDLAWRISEDLKYFKKITTQSIDGKLNAVIMGRKTWDSIPEKYRPLPNRINCILSRSYDFEDKAGDIRKFGSFESALQNLSLDENIDKIFVIGGGYLYNKVFSNKSLEYIYNTKVIGDFSCDVFVNKFPENFKIIKESETKEENEIRFKFEVYKRLEK